MKVKRFIAICVLLILVFALLPISVVAQSSPPKRGKPTATLPPAAPPIPTETPDTGILYGDLYIILRDENGLPVFADNGCIQPISSVTAEVVVSTIDGPLTISAVAGEPFALPTYTDPEGDLVECELTDEMAAWVQSVDFGRLNLGRAPDAVIAHAFDEAVNKMNAASAFDLDPAGRLMMLIDGKWFTVDAPAENLAMYIKMMTDGHWITLDTDPVEHGGSGGGGGSPEGDGPSSEPRPVLSDTAISLLVTIGYANLGDVNNVLNNHDLLLAASLLAGAGDKTGTLTLDKVIYINSIYGINQLGTLEDARGNKYFDFSVRDDGFPYGQNRSVTYGNRTSGDCGAGWIWALQPEPAPNLFRAQCVSILNKVQFNDYDEYYATIDVGYDYDDNVRGFAQSADDALQVLEYVHNYKVPEDLYAE